MSAQAVVGGSFATAVLGATMTSGETVETARSTKATAAALAQELAKTGTTTTELFVIVGVLFFFAGILLVGLARRHGVSAAGRGNLTARLRLRRGVPLPA